MAKKFILINPPRYDAVPEYFYRDFFLLGWADSFLPAGLLRMGSYLRSGGKEVSLINCCPGTSCFNAPLPSDVPHHVIGKRRCGSFKDKNIFSPLYHFGISFEDFRERLRAHEMPDEIYVTSFFTYQWEPVHQIISICKEVFPSARVTLGGVYPTLCPEHARTSLADLVHIGEFQATNDCRLALDLLEDVPEYISLKTSRGCPGRCSYCAVGLLEGTVMRYRPPEDVVDEIEDKVKKFGIKRVVFWEANILLNAKEHFECLLDLIIKRDLGLAFSFPEGFDPGALTEGVLCKMKQAGVEALALSLETTNKEVATKRFMSVDKFSSFQKKARLIKKLNFGKSYAFVMAGLPGQDVEDVRKTTLEVLRSGLVPLIQPFTPVPGTREYANCFKLIEKKGLEELHPLLWPCVEDSSVYDRLCKLHHECVRLI